MEPGLGGLDGSTGLEPPPKEKTAWESEKFQAVEEACKWRDLDKLRKLAESEGGFLADELRQQACMSPQPG